MMTYSKDLLLSLYRNMMTIRQCEESFVDPILDGHIKCPVHLTSGEEAIAVGISAHLNSQDKVFGNHRSHGHYLAKGGSLNELVAEVFCQSTGCSAGRGGSMHLIAPETGFLGSAPIVGGTISLALGVALAQKIQQTNGVTVTYFGDGATGEGVLFEAMNFASLNRLPIIFVCENNFYATHLPISETRRTDTIHDIAKPFGMASELHYGNDVLGVFEAAQKAVQRARDGEGPTFMEFHTYRLRGHVGPDDNIQGTHTDIRPPAELAAWREKDPIPQFRAFLINEGHAESSELAEIDSEIDSAVAEAHLLARSNNGGEITELEHHVFK